MAKDCPRILIVDDEYSMRELFARTLSREGYKVFTAASGEAGLKAMQKNGADLVVLDLKMPGMGGIETFRRIKKMQEDVPIIVITALPEAHEECRMIQERADAIFKKPFELEQVKEAVYRTLYKNRPTEVPPGLS